MIRHPILALTAVAGATLWLAAAVTARAEHGGADMAEQTAAGAVRSRVDFSYAFATPHRITVGLPDCSDRTLLDLQPGSLRMAWTYDDLTHYPLASFRTPRTDWDMRITPQIDGHAFARSRWVRIEGWLPALENVYDDEKCTATLEVVGAKTAAVTRIWAANSGATTRRFVLRVDSASWGENPAWVDPERAVGDNLVAGWNDRADRVLILAVGAGSYALDRSGNPPGPRSLVFVWDLAPGETRIGWLVRPYRAVAADLPALRTMDWAKQFEAGKRVWRMLIGRAARLTIPDPGVANVFKACLADIFIMREPVARGYIAGVPGTEGYRAANAVEAGIGAIGIDQLGLHSEAERGYRMCWDMQTADGNWNDPEGWGHLVWCCAGFKAWVGMEHYHLTHDRAFLEKLYPRLLASSRWQERERARTRVMEGGAKPLTYGLLPRGMGDCGLMNGDDLYGVFIPHNIWAVFADKLAVEAATILGKADDLPELRRIYETARRDLIDSMNRGAIEERGYRWIPGVPGKTTGSRWGVLNALFPTGLLDGHDPLIQGTLRFIESNVSKGGQPIHTGWMANGSWVAITVDNVAECHLALGNGDAAIEYLYSSINHATPLVTWCEERGQEPGTAQCSGDRQHLWTPVAVVRCLRDCLVMERDDGLDLALGTDRQWLASGEPLGIAKGATRFGTVSYEMRYDAGGRRVTGFVDFGDACSARWAALHVRLPDGLHAVSVGAGSGASVVADGLRWSDPRGLRRFDIAIGGPGGNTRTP